MGRSAGGQDQVVVIGSGMGGLAAAKVLSKHFGQVVVLEKDTVDSLNLQKTALRVAQEKRGRHGVTQYNQLHGMIAQGLKTYNAIFEGHYTPALEAAGGNIINIFTQFQYILPSGGPWLNNTTTREPATTAIASRHVLEGTARQLLAAEENVAIKYGTAAAGLVFTGSDGDVTAGPGGEKAAQACRPSVTGVLLSDGTALPADLVVDCSGRHSAVMDWLVAAGYEAPRVSQATANCGYAGFFVQLAPDVEAALSATEGLYFMAEAPAQTLALMWRVEHGLWQCCLGGIEGRHPPMKDAEMLGFAKAVWHPAAARLLAGARLLSPATRFYNVGNTWRHYEEARLPEGLVLLADSICSFNPIYGQGMTVAAMEVAAFDQILTERKERAAAIARASTTSSSSSSSRGWLLGLAHEVHQAAVPIIRQAWDMAAGSDLKFATAVSNEPRSSGVLDGIMQGYMNTVFKLAATDTLVNEAVIRVLHMMDGPQALVQPAVAGRVLLHHLTAPFASSGPSAAGTDNRDMASLMERLGLGLDGSSNDAVEHMGGGGMVASPGGRLE